MINSQQAQQSPVRGHPVPMLACAAPCEEAENVLWSCSQLQDGVEYVQLQSESWLFLRILDVGNGRQC